MRHLPLLPLIALCIGCAAHTPRFPGPLSAVGSDPRPYGVLEPRSPTPSEVPAVAAHTTPPSHLGDQVADAARHYLNHRPPASFRDDCSGFVCAVYTRADLPLTGNTRSLYETALAAGAVHRRKRPSPGDLVFFDDTVDRNRDGRWNDDLTHIAVVLSVDPAGTMVLAHAGTSQGRATIRMNLIRPHDHTNASGQTLNGFLRARRANDPPRARYLTAELWRGFATVHPDEIGRWAASLAAR